MSAEEEAVQVHGHCPMGCGETLTLEEGVVVCAEKRCPDRMRLAQIMDSGETEHIVVFDAEGFTIQHPLHERGGPLFECQLHQELRQVDARDGRYRVTWHQVDAYSESYRPGDGPFDFERLS